MGYDKLNSSQVGRLSALRFGPFLGAALLRGLGLGLPMPLGPVAAAVPGDTQDRANPESAREGGRRHRRCRQEQQQELEQQEQEGRGGPALSGLEQVGLLRHRHRWRCARNDFRRGRLLSRGAGAESLSVPGEPSKDTRLLGLLLTRGRGPAPVAQRIEHQTSNLAVAGSSPARRANKIRQLARMASRLLFY
jgi:hypothetical protein